MFWCPHRRILVDVTTFVGVRAGAGRAGSGRVGPERFLILTTLSTTRSLREPQLSSAFFPEDRCVPCRSASLCAREQRTSWPREEAILSHVSAPLHPSVSYIMPTIACRACLSPVQAILHFAASQYSSRCVHHLVEPGPSQSHLIEKVRDLAEPGPSLVRAT